MTRFLVLAALVGIVGGCSSSSDAASDPPPCVVSDMRTLQEHQAACLPRAFCPSHVTCDTTNGGTCTAACLATEDIAEGLCCDADAGRD